ncbi:J domain-containing protein [Paenibacillus sp. SYP-B3998]|nr:J domain-containing protein [Paenibacillus sp. SYP-B3998]
MTCWIILGIEPTTDISTIKKAYAKKLKIYHPEDDPEGYQKLREAYETARKRAERFTEMPEKSSQELDHSPVDLDLPQGMPNIEFEADMIEKDQEEKYTPPPLPAEFINDFKENLPTIEQKIDDFINQFESMYHSFFDRIDIEKWKGLLNSDVLWQVGYKKTLNDKVLKFLQNHHHLPRHVWLLLESNFNWREEKEYLYARFPEPFITYMFRQMDQIWELRYSYFKVFEGVNYEAFLDYREQAFFALIDNDLEQVKRCMAEAYAIYPDDPDLLRIKGEYYLRIGDKDGALAAFNHAIRIHPDDYDSYLYRARILYDKTQISSAISDCEYILLGLPDHIHARCLLAKCYMKLGDREKAREQFSQVLQRNPFDIEAKAYLAQIHTDIVAEIKKKPEGYHKAEMNRLYGQLGKRSPIDTTKAVLLVLFKRTWIYLAFIIICHLILHALFVGETGQTPNDFITHYLKTKVNTVKIETLEQLKGRPPGSMIQVNLSNARCLDMYEDTRTNSRGETRKVYISFDEAEEEGLYDVNFGYVCMGQLDDKTVMFIGKVDYWSKVLWEPDIQVRGKITSLETQELANVVIDEMEPILSLDGLMANQYIDAREDTRNSFEGVPKLLIIFILLLIVFYVYLIRELRRVYRAVKL